MEFTKRVVYLEDLEKPAPSISGATKENENVLTSVPQSSQTEACAVETGKDDGELVTVTEKKTTTGATKRQKSLTDMFPKKASESGPVPKKTKTDAPSLNSIPFSLKGYKDTMSDEERVILALECESMGKSWLKLLKDEIRKPYFLSLKRFLVGQGVKGVEDSASDLRVYPAPKNIYAWSNMTPVGRVKVVIIGQDPYHGPGQAHGLCFSVPPGVAVPPSLRNIYQEIKAEYPSFEIPKHGNLTNWAENGVLLLNTSLTVRAGEPASHSKRGWEEFTAKVVEIVDRYGGANLGHKNSTNAGRGRGIVFLAWGAHAAKVVAKLDKKKHLILTSAHPSPLSASRGFMGNGHFKKANEWLEEKYGSNGCVDWTKL